MKLKAIKVEAADEESGPALLGFDEGNADANEYGNNFIDSNENDDMHSPQTQSRWTTENTRLMLQLRFSRQVEFQQRLRQKKELWSEIADEMRRRGLCDSSLTAEGCDLKYRNMLQTYKKNRFKEDSGMQSLIVWEYYEMFKEAHRIAEEAEAQEVHESIEPSMLCDTVCDGQSDEMHQSGPVYLLSEIDGNGGTLDDAQYSGEIGRSKKPAIKEVIPIVTGGNRKRSKASRRRQVVKEEKPPSSPKTAASSDIGEQPIVDAAASSATQENDAIITSNEMAQPILILKSETLTRPKRQRRSMCDTVSAPSAETAAVEMPAIEVAGTPLHMQSEPDISSSSMSVPPPLTQAPVTLMHPNNMQTVPAPHLAPNEVRECQVFGESIGIQLINIHEPHTRAVLQLKIQELLYLAKTGKLYDNIRI